PNPVGAESIYEFVPMFYQVSGTFKQIVSVNDNSLIRINPMRAGEETVIRILTEGIRHVLEKNNNRKP
ncbi:MAG: hypothetical protein ACRCUP_05210, partial [Mycoplasmatales bacterium]